MLDSEQPRWPICLIHSKLGLVILFIPGLNLLFYLLLLFLFGEKKAFVISFPAIFVSAVLVAFSYYAYPVISDLLFLLIILLVDYSLAGLLFYALKKSNSQKKHHNKAKLLIVCGLLIAIIVAAVSIIISTKEIRNITEIYFSAIAENDEEKYNSVLYYPNNNLNLIRKEYSEEGIELTEPLVFKRVLSFKQEKTANQKTVDVRWIVKIGDSNYLLTVHYLKDSRGNGIKSFDLEKK